MACKQTGKRMITRDQLSAAIVHPDTPIIEAIKAIDAGSIQAVLVSPDGKTLLGMVTDGDIRRGILRGVTLDSGIRNVMNDHPATLQLPASREQAMVLMRSRQIRQVPVLDPDGEIAGVYHIDIATEPAPADDTTWVVIMAGGRGTRLHPLTETTPKPMLPVGGQPLIETIIRTLVDQGFHHIFLSVNYMGDVFKAHFGDGSRFGAEIRYIEETTRLGTAGALGLLPERPPGPFLVMNGDLLTAVNFNNLITYHKEHGALATMCVRDYQVQIPYGVIELEGPRVSAIAEKPVKTYFVNAGMYVIDPQLVERIEPGKYLDMTQLLEDVLGEGGTVGSFPIHEYWLDIGKFDDLERAQAEFHRVFGA